MNVRGWRRVKSLFAGHSKQVQWWIKDALNCILEKLFKNTVLKAIDSLSKNSKCVKNTPYLVDSGLVETLFVDELDSNDSFQRLTRKGIQILVTIFHYSCAMYGDQSWRYNTAVVHGQHLPINAYIFSEKSDPFLMRNDVRNFLKNSLSSFLAMLQILHKRWHFQFSAR